jgi:acetyl-CoA carboxylase biotin carboxyl carrier protein
MNEARIRKLIEIFRESGVEEMEYRESFWRGISLRLGRRSESGPVHFTAAAPAPAPAAPAAASPAAAPPAAPAEPASAPVDDSLHAVTSPMVGTFYTSPSPDSEPFVATGDRVKKGQTVCIIEAMKIMNEIEADVDGEIVEIAAPNGEPVEYGQALFRIRPG